MDKVQIDQARVRAGASAEFIDAVIEAYSYAQARAFNGKTYLEDRAAILQLAIEAAKNTFENRRTEAIAKELQYLSHAVAHSNRY